MMTEAAAVQGVALAPIADSLPGGVPVAARTRPGVRGAWTIDLGSDAQLARAIQKAAAAAHRSQEEALTGLIRRLDQLSGVEAVRWLLSPARIPAQRAQALP